jgi:glycerol-1-phosphate dehydrogenase [NAD(P)+]
MSTQEHGGASPASPAGSSPASPAGPGPPNPARPGPVGAAEPVRLDLDALRGELAASPGAARLRSLDLRRVIEGDGALDELARAVAEFPGSGAGVVVLAAATPMTVAGRDLQAEATEVLGRGFGVDWVTLGPADGQVHADEPTVAAACQAARGAGCVVTIGSGTITDIGKFAAGHGTPLVVVQTATSVNGYADPFSVLLHHGVKRTSASRWPDTLLIDPSILRAAPAGLNRAGVGDLASMFSSTADWYLASVVGTDLSYDQAVTGLSRRHGARLLALAAGLQAGFGSGTAAETRPGGSGGSSPRADTAAEPRLSSGLAELARILTLSGIAMGVAGSTAPSSGMEHAISHLLEMTDTARGRYGSFHGTKVGVASIVAAATWAHVRRRIAEGALDRPAAIPDPDQAREHISAAFKGIDPGGGMAAECFADYARKLAALAAGATDPLAGLRAGWESHDAALGEVLTGPAELAGALGSAGLPVRFGALPDPVDDGEVRWAVANCALLRRRFGVADLAMLLGCWQDDDVGQVLADAAVLTGQP